MDQPFECLLSFNRQFAARYPREVRMCKIYVQCFMYDEVRPMFGGRFPAAVPRVNWDDCLQGHSSGHNGRPYLQIVINLPESDPAHEQSRLLVPRLLDDLLERVPLLIDHLEIQIVPVVMSKKTA